MIKSKRMTVSILAGVALLGALWGLARVISVSNQPDPLLYSVYFDVFDNADSMPKWHVVIYLDVDACLSCNEDMDAWRELVVTLRENKVGTVSVYAPREDSSDVYWAMKLEEIADTVRVLEDEIVDALGWDDLGSPIKVLLDNHCRPVKIAGWMGNVRQSRCFIEEVLEQIRPHGQVVAASD